MVAAIHASKSGDLGGGGINLEISYCILYRSSSFKRPTFPPPFTTKYQAILFFTSLLDCWSVLNNTFSSLKFTFSHSIFFHLFFFLLLKRDGYKEDQSSSTTVFFSDFSSKQHTTTFCYDYFLCLSLLQVLKYFSIFYFKQHFTIISWLDSFLARCPIALTT